jgi:hypothetical protein
MRKIMELLYGKKKYIFVTLFFLVLCVFIHIVTNIVITFSKCLYKHRTFSNLSKTKFTRQDKGTN